VPGGYPEQIGDSIEHAFDLHHGRLVYRAIRWCGSGIDLCGTWTGPRRPGQDSVEAASWLGQWTQGQPEPVRLLEARQPLRGGRDRRLASIDGARIGADAVHAVVTYETVSYASERERRAGMSNGTALGGQQILTLAPDPHPGVIEYDQLRILVSHHRDVPPRVDTEWLQRRTGRAVAIDGAFAVRDDTIAFTTIDRASSQFTHWVTRGCRIERVAETTPEYAVTEALAPDALAADGSLTLYVTRPDGARWQARARRLGRP
jgi:hypothetical protein